ncbi:lectin-like domain-containing protein [Lentilactobacillus sp. SPB1-3]|uniref:DUF5776 domain-containing protein n=1 Tax=Lentilactobacillus terminaliae TaxID=3003483 RepID=A0ACD5DEG3_9LACO|nr:DUF5776 domain-containing protein [Lentilactobacillus sp. SPB1-3]MCZ0977631.1 DUF5776 domain-containing protein [Lentilactobacillus sp. SPB1-3]
MNKKLKLTLMMSAALFVGVTGTSFVPTHHVLADTTATSSDSDAGSVTLSGDQLNNLFTTTGKASISNTAGQVNLVPGNAGIFSSAEAGSVYLNGNIDMSKSFELSVDVNLASKRPIFGTKSDGIIFAFRPGDPTVVGNPGSGMGIGGIQGAFGVTLDTYHNSDNQFARSYKDPSTDPYISFFQNNYDGNEHDFDNVNSGGGDTLTGPANGYAKQWIDNTNTGGKGAQAVGKNNLGDSDWLPLDILYDGSTHKLTYTLKTNGGGQVIATDTYDFSDRINLYGNYMNLSISSGDSYASQASANVRFNTLTLHPVAVTNVNYMDTDGNKVADTSTLNTPINPTGDTTATIEPKSIDGYELDHVEGPAEYDSTTHILTIKNGATLNGDLLQNITFYYKKVETSEPGNPGTGGGNTDPSNPGTGGGSTEPGDPGTGGGNTDPSEPGTGGGNTDPSNPGTGGGNTDPSNPGNGGGSTGPSNPGNSGGSTEPSNPGTGGGTTEPSNPGTGGGTTEPSNPGTGGGTTEPSNPGNSGGSTNPSNPGNSGGSTEPSNPGNGGGTTEPSNPGVGGGNTNSSNPGIGGSTNPNKPAESGDMPNWAAVKGQSVYGIKGFYLYKSANFSKGQRIKGYAKTTRVNRPQFVVKNYKRDAKGNLRYYVQQYNPYTGKYIKGTTGYITANQKYVVKAYYQSVPKNKKIIVINKNGVKTYRNVKLSGKSKLYKKGSVLKVKAVKNYKLTTRYQLSNGQYVTGSKKFVIWK